MFFTNILNKHRNQTYYTQSCIKSSHSLFFSLIYWHEWSIPNKPPHIYANLLSNISLFYRLAYILPNHIHVYPCPLYIHILFECIPNFDTFLLLLISTGHWCLKDFILVSYIIFLSLIFWVIVIVYLWGGPQVNLSNR